MSSFTRGLRWQSIPNSDGLAVLWEGFEYHIDTYPSPIVIRVPRGRITDFGSFPWWMWMIHRPYGRYAAAYVAHDEDYWMQTVSRKEADRRLREGIKILGSKKVDGRYVVPWRVKLDSQLIYYGLRLTGWWAWLNNKADRYRNPKQRSGIQYLED